MTFFEVKMFEIAKVISKCRKAGLKLTPQRLAIFKILENNTSHPTVESIYNSLRKDYPTMSLTTVYNTLETLFKIGEVVKLDIDSDKAHFDPNTNPHHHFLCTHCGKIEDVMADFSEVLHNETVKEKLFKIQDYNINFRGICLVCSR